MSAHTCRVAAEIAALRRAAERARADAMWSEHDSHACWYAGRLRAARGLENQAARSRAAAADADARAAELAAQLPPVRHAWPVSTMSGSGL